MAQHHVVIVGGGFAGLAAAKALADRDVRVTLVDRRNFHLFQPLLYQVATGGLSPADICAPIRAVLRSNKNIRTELAEVTGFDLAGKKVLLADGEMPFDSLLVAAGARHHYFGNEQWEPLAPGLKTIKDATAIRRKILLALVATTILALSGCGYNTFQSGDEQVKASWSEVLNQYQRRAEWC